MGSSYEDVEKNILSLLENEKERKLIGLNGFNIIKNAALGADMVSSARAMMLALGCIQALECNKNICPTGVATQDPSLMKGLDINDKYII